ncbi:C-C chemokine receptor type 4-like, partial [Clarias magur]
MESTGGYLESTTPSMATSEDYSDYSDYYNNSIDAEPCDYEVHAVYFLPVLYSLFFMVGFLGNMLVLWVIVRGKLITNMTEIALLNLAIADLLLISSLPFLAHYARDTWIFGNVMCTLVLGVYYIGFYAGIFFIVLMSIDRYLAIAHPVFSTKIHSKAWGIFASMIIWIIAVAASFPELLYLGVEAHDGKHICNAYPKDENHNGVRSAALFKMNVLGMLIPLGIVGFCYSVVLCKLQTLHSPKKNAFRLVVVVMVVFFCCWIPYNIAAFLKALELRHILPSECELSKRIQLMLQATEAVAYAHSCLNPFLYVFFGEKFRRHLT